MEIVERLKSPEGEESSQDFDFDFKEHYLKKDAKEREPSKKIYLILLGGIVTVGILGYISFISFQKNNITEVKVATLSSDIKEVAPIIESNIDNTVKPKPPEQKEIIKKEAPVIVLKEEVKKVSLYTEVLALDHAAKVEPEINKETISKPTIKIPRIILEVKEKEIIPKKITVSKNLVEKTRTVIVKKGDTLALLSQKFYGNSMEFERIIRANKSIKSHKTSLKLGQKIIIPYMKKSKRRRFVIVKSGYSLAYISKKFYGNIREVQRIVDANQNIKNKNSTIKIGQKIYVPR